ncbi:MAG: hypothetical protein IKY26_10085 [Erysipelotrichaceae bacterium]|nr:hypothetical protein [Erysipelotrichaceae bacterium]
MISNHLKEHMLINYYSKTYHVNGYSSYEMVLSTTPQPNEVKLDIYTKQEDANETCSTIYLPINVVEECMKWIQKCQMNQWNENENTESLDGKLLVCKHYFNGEYIRVSTDCMPENGEQMIEEVANIISKHTGKNHE